LRWLFALLLLSLAMPARADEARPLYIEARQTGAASVELAWRIPPNLAPATAPALQFPDDCTASAAPREWSDEIGHHQAQAWTCRQPLEGRSFTIVYPMGNPNLPTIYRSVLPSGSATISMMLPGRAQVPLPTATGKASSSFADYLKLGVEHIWLGFDHLLFVACLVWIAGGWRRIAATVTGFTLGHSITLAAAALDLVSVPIQAIEVLIALSIVLLAVELARGRSHTITWRHPMAVASAFGLLHGFGFAAVLREVGLPQDGLPGALLAFNLGIELGQLLFVAALLGLAAALTRVGHWAMLALPSPPSAALQAAVPRLLVAYSVGITATYWMLQRAA
jgi:hypothetical protein